MRLIDVERLKDDIAVLLERNEKLIDPWLVYGIDDTIDEQTVIEAEPVRRGRWIDHQYKEFPIGRYECSVCGARHDMPWNYCPNCGTRMEEQE